MAILSDKARTWAQRILKHCNPSTIREDFQERASWDVECMEAALLADELLDALKIAKRTIHQYGSWDEGAKLVWPLGKIDEVIAKAERRT